MKKTVCLILMIIVVFSAISCGANKDDNAHVYGKKAYDNLVEAEEICLDLADAIYNAWYFSIYEVDDYSGNTSVLVVYRDFASETGVTFDEMVAACEKLTGQSKEKMQPYYYDLFNDYIDDFSGSVDLILQIFKDRGVINELNESIEIAKDNIKSAHDMYTDYGEYPSLKAYFSKVNSYSNFLKNPTGSFEQLKVTIETYEREMRDCRGELELSFAY